MYLVHWIWLYNYFIHSYLLAVSKIFSVFYGRSQKNTQIQHRWFFCKANIPPTSLLDCINAWDHKLAISVKQSHLQIVFSNQLDSVFHSTVGGLCNHKAFSAPTLFAAHKSQLCRRKIWSSGPYGPYGMFRCSHRIHYGQWPAPGL